MQTFADMRGVGVKNRENFADVLCGRPPIINPYQDLGFFFTFLADLAFCARMAWVPYFKGKKNGLYLFYDLLSSYFSIHTHDDI